jgi:hypothetical protein
MFKMKKFMVCFGVLALVALLAAPMPAAADEKVQDWQLVNPMGAMKVTPIKLAPRITTLEGKTIGLKWNQKPNGNILLDRVAELLKEKYPTAKIIKFYEVEPTTVPQTANEAQAKKKAEIIASYKPDIVIGSQCD